MKTTGVNYTKYELTFKDIQTAIADYINDQIDRAHASGGTQYKYTTPESVALVGEGLELTASATVEK